MQIFKFCRLVKNKPAVFLLMAVFLIAAVRLNHITKTALVNRTGQTFEKGIVTEVLQDNIQEDGIRIGEQTVSVLMTSGVRKGTEVTMKSSAGYLFGAVCSPGMHIIVMQSVAGTSTVSSVYARDRGSVLLIFAALYLFLLCAVGRGKGVRAAAGLLFTFACIVYLMIPLIYLGISPVISAVLICTVTTAATFYMLGGICRKTEVATAGTVAGVVMSGITAAVFAAVSGIGGWNVSNIESLQTLWEVCGVRVGGLLFAGILISSLGAVMDVAMSISSAMEEICKQNPAVTRKELFAAGMRIGSDMMGTDSNTLILAFAGSEISVLILNYAYDLPLLQILNSNNIGIAVMQGLSGSFGIVLCVPLTVLIASVAYRP